jgi:hypothetical protein
VGAVESEDDAVDARLGLDALGEDDVLEVLPATAPVAAGTLAVFLQPASGRATFDFGHLAAGIGDQEIDVGFGLAPRCDELQIARADAAAFLEQAVAVVVDAVEAELGPGGDAGRLERDAIGRHDFFRHADR